MREVSSNCVPTPGVLRERYLWLVDADRVPVMKDCAAPII